MANPSFRRILLIGLGGSGQRIVLQLKRRFLDTYGVVPPSVKMICLDTDAATTVLTSATGDTEYRLDPHEFVHIKVTQPEVFISGTPHVAKWFVKPIPAGAITAGAGAVRQNGRLGLFHNLLEFLNRVTNIHTQLTSANLHRQMANAKNDLNSSTDFDLSPKDTEIYVCGSLAGGTGSGTFLDVGILLRDMMPTALIHGFFMLDWLYRRNAFAYRVGGNVYAALAELDNLQSITYGSDTFVPYQVNYGHKTIQVEKPPYTLFHLIDGRNETGENISDPNEVADIIASAIYLSVGEMGPAIASVVDNLMTHIGVGAPHVWQGKYARYSSLGVSCIYYPARALHRREAAEQALQLCEAAIKEAGSATAGSQLAAHADNIKQDVDGLVKFLGLAGDPVLKPILDAIEPKLTPPAFPPPTPYEVTDSSFPSILAQRQQDEEAGSDRDVQSAFETHGLPIIATAVATVTKKLQQLEQDRSLSPSYRREWVTAARAALEVLSHKATEQLNQATEQLAATRAMLNAELQRASGLKSAWISNPRKAASLLWAQKVNSDLLPEYRRRAILERSRVLLDQLSAALQPSATASTPQTSQALTALNQAARRLRRALGSSLEEIEGIRKKTNHIVLGNGSVIIPGQLRESLSLEGEIQEVDTVLRKSVIVLRYDVFKRARKINVSDDYLSFASTSATGLADLFFQYAAEHLSPLAEESVDQALEFYARDTGRPSRDYVTEQFNHLFRLASPLWTYSRSLIDATRRPHYDKILNIGVGDAQHAGTQYDEIVQEIKAKYGIGTNHTFNTTRDHERIWLLGYAAALPAYFVQTLQENRKAYEEEISPPFHIDRYFETEVPDIFPQTDADNVALRVLGMAIVPDIDIVLDEKQERGHRFTCFDEEVQRLNGNEPRVWRLFRTMYDDVRSMPDLRAILTRRLKERFKSKSKDDVALLALGDLKNPAQIIAKLKESTDSRLGAIAAMLSPSCATALSGFSGDVVPEDLERVLLDDLNQILKRSSCLFDERMLRTISPSPTAQALLDRHRSKALAGADLLRLNRLLLQETLPAEIGRSVRSAIETYIAVTRKKLDNRDFSRLISARLTYREIAALQTFLSTSQGGYAMDIDRYIAGR
jgi:Tubulin like